MVGAGEVGSYVAGRFSSEGHDVSIIDIDGSKLDHLNTELDVLTVEGSGTHPSVLEEAGLQSCDLVVAVSNSDEVNLVTSLIAKQNGVESTIARIEAAELRSRAAANLRAAFAVDLVVDPDYETAVRILDLLDYPGASEVALMAHGEVVVIGASLSSTSPLVGCSIADITADYGPDWDFMIGSITRSDELIIPRNNTQLKSGDLIRVVCRRRYRRKMTRLLGLNAMKHRHILLLGGGRTAEVLAKQLAGRGVRVLIVERSPSRALELAEQLPDALVIEGDITDADVLEEAQISRFNLVVALTGDDKSNILACLYAKAAGAEETIAVVHELVLLPLLRFAGVDVALSPRTAISDGVLRFVRGDVTAVATFLETETEVLELEVPKGSSADGSTVRELELPQDVLLGMVVRDGKSFVARAGSRLRSHDHIIAFAMPDSVKQVEQKFKCE